MYSHGDPSSKYQRQKQSRTEMVTWGMVVQPAIPAPGMQRADHQESLQRCLSPLWAHSCTSQYGQPQLRFPEDNK